MKRSWTIVAVAGALALPLAASGDETPTWSNWRGPAYNGSIETGALPAELDLEHATVWKTALRGQGAGTPIEVGGRVFLPAFEAGTQKLWAVALDRESGAILWEKECGTGREPSPRSRGRENTLAAGSPATDGERVFFLFGSGDLWAFDLGGEPQWHRDLAEEYGPFVINWGYAASPLAHGGALYVPILHRGKSFVLSLDPASGETNWAHERPNEANAESQEAYTTPIPFQNGERAEILVLGADCLTSHDPATGKELWRWCGLNPQNRPNYRTVSTVVAGDDGMLYVTSPQHGPMHALRVEGDEVEKMWEHTRPTPDSTTPLYYRERLFAVDGRNSRMVCLDPWTGEAIWTAELETSTFLRASPTGSDGKIWVVDAEGMVVVVAAADEYNELSRTSFASYPTRSTLVPSRGQLLVRTAEALHCIGHSDGVKRSEDG